MDYSIWLKLCYILNAWLAHFNELRTGVRNINVSFTSISVLGQL